MIAFRLPMIILLAVMLDMIAPVAMRSAPEIDEFEEAVHRPKVRTAIRLVRNTSNPKIAGPLQAGNARIRLLPFQLRLRASSRTLMTYPIRIPAPPLAKPSSPEDH